VRTQTYSGLLLRICKQSCLADMHVNIDDMPIPVVFLWRNGFPHDGLNEDL
jgi:hypothetical protein